MNKYHRCNVWRIANVCPVCGSERGYSQANPGGIEFNCSDKVNCGFTEFLSNEFIHNECDAIDRARFEVLDSNNRVKDGWFYTPKKHEREAMATVIKQEEERRIWLENEMEQLKKKMKQVKSDS